TDSARHPPVLVRGGTGRRGWPCPATGAAGHGCIRAATRPPRPARPRSRRTARRRGGSRFAGSGASARPCRWWSASTAWPAALDPIAAVPLEQHLGGPGLAEPAGEHLPVVGQHLIRDPV